MLNALKKLSNQLSKKKTVHQKKWFQLVQTQITAPSKTPPLDELEALGEPFGLYDAELISTFKEDCNQLAEIADAEISYRNLQKEVAMINPEAFEARYKKAEKAFKQLQVERTQLQGLYHSKGYAESHVQKLKMAASDRLYPEHKQDSEGFEVEEEAVEWHRDSAWLKD